MLEVVWESNLAGYGQTGIDEKLFHRWQDGGEVKIWRVATTGGTKGESARGYIIDAASPS